MIRVQLGINDLRTSYGHRACDNGIELFQNILHSANEERRARGLRPSYVLEGEWTPLHQVMLASAYPDFFVWLIENNLVPMLSLSDVDLAGVDLSSIALPGCDLSNAKLSSANLHGADLRGATLVEADLRATDLSYASLARADLTDADLHSAYLNNADLRYAVMPSNNAYTSTCNADLSDARWYNAAPPPRGWVVSAEGLLRRQ